MSNEPQVESLEINCGCVVFKNGTKRQCARHAKEAWEKSWEGCVDTASGAFTDYEKDPHYHEMGH